MVANNDTLFDLLGISYYKSGGTQMSSTKKTVLVCTECKSEKVLQEAYVNPNDMAIISVFPTFYCEDCDGECHVEEKQVSAPSR